MEKCYFMGFLQKVGNFSIVIFVYRPERHGILQDEQGHLLDNTSM